MWWSLNGFRSTDSTECLSVQRSSYRSRLAASAVPPDRPETLEHRLAPAGPVRAFSAFSQKLLSGAVLRFRDVPFSCGAEGAALFDSASGH